MKTSMNGIELLKTAESTIRDANGKHVIYDDKTGRAVPIGAALPIGATIGYGHLIKTGEDFRKGLTEQQAIKLLQQDLFATENAIKNYINVPINQNQFDALVLLIYNIGIGAFENSTIRKFINNPNYKSNTYPTPESAWKAFNKTGGKISRGLINRRNAEWNLFIRATNG